MGALARVDFAAGLLRLESGGSPLVPRQRGDAAPEATVSQSVISLRAMCCKFWLEEVQYLVRRDLPKTQLFAIQRYLSDLPRKLKEHMIHNALKAGGLHLAHGSRELSAVNRALVFLDSDIAVHEMIFLTIPRPTADGLDWPPDLELLLRHGEGVTRMTIALPPLLTNASKRILADLYRTCKKLTHVSLHSACDEALTLVTRHCQCLSHLWVAESLGITDEGVSRMVVNLRWADDDEKPTIRLVDVGKTSVTTDSIVNMLSRLPCLTSMGSTDVIESLQVLDVTSEGGGGAAVTQLEDINLRCATVSNLQLLRRMCPRLKAITVTLQEVPGATLNDLRLLPHLRHLKLVVREPFLLSPGNLYDLSWDLGPKLQTLRVSGDIYWEADLGLIAASCPNLEDLSLPAVTFPNKESLKVLLTLDSPALMKLRVLELDCMTGAGPKAWAKDFNLIRLGLVATLKKCFLLAKLTFRPTNLVESNLLEILSVNRLQHLEVLELYSCVLGLNSARLLVDTCVNLHVMKGLKTWRGLTLQELVLLRKYARGHRRMAELKILP